MDDILKQTLLYDFYGELLTEHQKDVYEMVVLDDYSVSEVARETGISRQGVHDLVRRCNAALEEYEAKLHLVERFVSVKDKIQLMDSLIDHYDESDASEWVRKMKKLSGEIIEVL